ncbi:PaaI family thioesterase [Streptomyces sp. NPDC093586]|uniref:PaaI family thioesterase n=1 Tax=Streptomyces sp. NPDC093586 TaxID=3366042 RepID=UPI00381B4086
MGRGCGRIALSLDTRPDFANPLGTVRGGIAATLLDSAMGRAVHSALPARTDGRPLTA